MKCTALVAAAVAAVAAADSGSLTGYDCDQGDVARGFGPIIGLLNDCVSASGYNFLPVPSARPTQEQLMAFCSVSACQVAAEKYPTIRLPACDFDLGGQRVVAKTFFGSLCQSYASFTAPPTSAPTPAPSTTVGTKAPSADTTTPTKSAATTASVVAVVTAVAFAVIL
ncbi:hypothetical protein ACHHYP_20313 [Achlya hypogyna]|uniref:Elicitin n=1 Tax=Achlya hypogyna TaxID=1202772 RepID=A0A1V9YRI8_ACHHY|nr:hypothetical protein ACHHYP_20313 [Achlya hypogyna]